MFSPNVQPSEYLPSINSKVESVRLAYGSMVRLCIHSAAYHGTKGLLSELVFGNKGALDVSERHAICYILSMAGEAAVSVLWMPIRYLAAVNTPRFLLDYLLTSWSEVLRLIDRFHPGRFASYALYAFTSDVEADWNLDFFVWQVPSIVLTIGKLIMRRGRVGVKRCRTKRVVGILFMQILLRAYLATFSVMVPETSGEAFAAMLVTVLEGLCTTYLARHTWPFPFEEAADVSSGGYDSTALGATATRSSSGDEAYHHSESVGRDGGVETKSNDGQGVSMLQSAHAEPSLHAVALD